MCGIVGSYSISKLLLTVEALAQRGTRAYSISCIDLDSYKLLPPCQFPFTEKQKGITEKDFESLLALNITNPYWIVHFQSPTASNFSFHPARNKRAALWHNGMIDSAELEKYKDAQGNRPWDTELLLTKITEEGLSNTLDTFQGSFACIYLIEGSELVVFRNSIAPMYIDREGTVCSISFPDAQKLESNVIRSLPSLEKVSIFNNTYNPFGI